MIIVEKGSGPLLLCLPHVGSDIPPTVNARLSATGRLQADISWRLEHVFDVARELDATIVRSTVSRYVIDVDRDASDDQVAEEASELPLRELLCPQATLDLKNIYKPEEEPGPVEIEQRRMLFYDPFHRALNGELARLRATHDNVILFDCQSVRSRIRGFVEGELPTLNVGTAEGQSCAPDARNTFVGSFTGLSGYTVAVDGVFKGGHITRQYGNPERGVHAMTLVIAQRTYLRHESPPFEPDKSRIARLQTTLIEGLSRVADWAQGAPGADLHPAPAPVFDLVSDSADDLPESELDVAAGDLDAEQHQKEEAAAVEDLITPLVAE
ncbi:N-formylglutamate amidohydrolase [Roseibium sp.]|uniref:N-formylglutamate amidohydrolase n=1 Tax=Roseibium sp. TaxID=1936156 RepID=UPI003A96A3AE